jgi:hypothetical protein
MRWLQLRTEHYVCLLWKEIEGLADELLVHREIAGNEATKAIKERLNQ